MDLKQRILQETSQLLFTVGLSSTTMDMVARSCGISKRTLYEQFSDKRTLVEECLKAGYKKSSEDFKAITEASDDCFDALFRALTYVRNKLSEVPATFYSDLKRLYPDLYVSLQKGCDHKRVSSLSVMLGEGKKEGLVEEHVSTHVAAFLFFALIEQLHNNKRIAEYNISQIEIFDCAFVTFLRGVASAKGLELIEGYIPKYNKQHNI